MILMAIPGDGGIEILCSLDLKIRVMRISKYDNDFTWERTLELAARCVQMGIYQDFSKIFDSLPKTEFCRISGMNYSRIKLLCRKPNIVRDAELVQVLAVLPGCTENMVRSLFGLPAVERSESGPPPGAK
jgi:hypothetical protein